MPFDLTELIELPSLLVAQKKLFSEKYRDDPAFVSVLFNEFDTEKDGPFFSGFEPDKIKIESRNLFDNLKKIGRYLLEEYEKIGRHNWPHADQRRVLEKAIRILDKAEKAVKDEDTKDVCLELGKAYLYRGRIIRPKGFTIPAKKKEALKEAFGFCQKSKEALTGHFAGMVAIEMDRCDDIAFEHLKNYLKQATSGIDPFEKYKDDIERQIEFYQMLVRLGEINKDLEKNAGLKKIFEFTRQGLELEKFKVALHNISNSDNSKKRTETCYYELIWKLEKTPFSHPLWEDTVRFLVRLHKEDNQEWQVLAIAIWTAAEKLSSSTSSLHLRWYWARQRDLYDLAFLAAVKRNCIENNIKLAAIIADTAKSRPALTWQAIERMITQDADIDEKITNNLKKDIENYALALAGGYIKFERGHENRDKIDYRKQINQEAHKIDEVLERISNNQIIVQFYLVHLSGNEKGYALVYEGKTKDWRVSHKTEDDTIVEYSFDFRDIWEKYVQWQTAYLDFPIQKKYKSADQLVSLCRELGQGLNFLFELSGDNTKNRNMLLIPHDFLHRVPIHGAIINEDILLYTFNCSYLPALSYLPQKFELAPNKPVLLQYFDKSKETDVEKINLFINT